ncbi:MAG: hypothetical protein OXG56_11365 [Gammaproteobacteria bacterium]|nr:hypothetical protein [Gammaproteobacteria bacterium]
MSEYQYYEFRAIDTPIDNDGMNALRQVSSRAEITPTSFINEYNYGDFRGNARQFMSRWFDMHVYVANWGTRRLMMRLPGRLADRSKFDPFIRGCELVNVLDAGENIILDFDDCDEDGQYSGEWEEGSGWLSGMITLRADFLSGDWRMLYVAWLWAVSLGHIRDEVPEPLPGIAPLTGPLTTLAEFFHIDADLVAAAAERPAGTAGHLSSKKDIEDAISGISDNEKTKLLCQLAEGDPHVSIEVRKLVREFSQAGVEPVRLRTAGELRARSKEVCKERKIAEAKHAEAKREQRRQEAERMRLQRIAEVAKRGEAAWSEIDKHMKIKSGRSYDDAAQLLFDLKTIANENSTTEHFFLRLEDIRRRYARRPRFLERIERLR